MGTTLIPSHREGMDAIIQEEEERAQQILLFYTMTV